MKIKIIALGEKMPKWVLEGASEYTKRLPKGQMDVSFMELPIAKRTKTGLVNKWLEEEAKLILAKLDKQDHLVILDVKSKLISTEDLSIKLANWQENHPSVVIVIGGPDGIDNTIKEKAKEKISLSKMTFPHPLVRVILAEQLYRAWSILQNHPYHK